MPDSSDKREWRDVKRQAGCLLGCLTEPFLLVGLALGSLFGVYVLGRKVERRRYEKLAQSQHTQNAAGEDEESGNG